MYDQILVPTDGSETAEHGATHGCRLAAAVGAGVQALGVVDTAAAGLFETDVAYAQELRAAAQSGVDRVAEIAASHGLDVETSCPTGAPVETILEYASRADLVAMGTHGRTGVERFALGSVAERVLRRASVPVVTARNAATEAYDSLLVPTDGSETAGRATDRALAIAEATQATVHAVHVVDLALIGAGGGGGAAPELARQLEERGQAAVSAIDERATAAGLSVQTAVERGSPGNEILRYADREGIDMVVMGTAGRTGLNRVFLGSTTERVIRHATCPVMAVNARDES